jgi:hypothetical protein
VEWAISCAAQPEHAGAIIFRDDNFVAAGGGRSSAAEPELPSSWLDAISRH